jgi:hypothetical protein
MLQSAVSADAATSLNYQEYERGLALSRAQTGQALNTPTPAPTRASQSASETRVAGGRTFFLNNGVWVDSLAQTGKPSGEPVLLKVGSDGYFALIRQHPEAAAWVAVGARVSFVLDGKLFQITD